ncbi:MAG: hypothetical protein LUP92_03340 [Methanomicrobiales archaeon]|nr:hypothetical protein [Methanomicrobiales archaeon]
MGPILSWCDLVVRAVERHRKAFASVFGKELAISHQCGGQAGPGTRSRD